MLASNLARGGLLHAPECVQRALKSPGGKTIIMVMKAAVSIPEGVLTRGERIYQERLRALLEPAHHGKIVVINVENGEYEIDTNHLAAIKRARARWPHGQLFSARVGFDTVAHIGARFGKPAE